MYITEYKCKFDAADIAILNGLEQGFFFVYCTFIEFLISILRCQNFKLYFSPQQFQPFELCKKVCWSFTSAGEAHSGQRTLP